MAMSVPSNKGTAYQSCQYKISIPSDVILLQRSSFTPRSFWQSEDSIVNYIERECPESFQIKNNLTSNMELQDIWLVAWLRHQKIF